MMNNFIDETPLNEQLTKEELKQILEESKKQRSKYEKEHGILLADERKKAMYD